MTAALVSLLALALTPVSTAAPVPSGVPAAPEVTAPVAYRDLMLVLVTKDGAAAVVFEKPSADGDAVEYSFRFESADGKKKEGTGKLFERRLKDGGYDPAGLSIVAGPISVTWSRGGEERGWVYYSPESVSVHIAHAKNFKSGTLKVGKEVIPVQELDLKRFMKK